MAIPSINITIVDGGLRRQASPLPVTTTGFVFGFLGKAIADADYLELIEPFAFTTVASFLEKLDKVYPEADRTGTAYEPLERKKYYEYYKDQVTDFFGRIGEGTSCFGVFALENKITTTGSDGGDYTGNFQSTFTFDSNAITNKGVASNLLALGAGQIQSLVVMYVERSVIAGETKDKVVVRGASNAFEGKVDAGLSELGAFSENYIGLGWGFVVYVSGQGLATVLPTDALPKSDGRKTVCIYAGANKQYGGTDTIAGKSSLAGIGEYVAATLSKPVDESTSTQRVPFRTDTTYQTNGENVQSTPAIQSAVDLSKSVVIPFFQGEERAVFLSTPITQATETSDYTEVPEVRVINKFIRIIKRGMNRFISESLSVTASGDLQSIVKKQIEDTIQSLVEAGASKATGTELSAFNFTIPSGQNITATRMLNVEAAITPNGRVNAIILRIGLATL